MLSMLSRSLAQEADQSAFRMTPKQRKYTGYMAATMTHSRACLASPKNIATFLYHYSFPPIFETLFFVYLFLIFSFLHQHHNHIFSSTTTTTGTTIITSSNLLLLLSWKHVEFYLHAHKAWCSNMHWMLRIVQAENDLRRNHSLSIGNDSCKGLFIAVLNALW
jgi:hypothetical protein